MTEQAAERPSRPTDFHASIEAYIDRELTAAHIDEGYEIRSGEQPLALLGEPRHEAVVRGVTRAGAWWFTRRRGAAIEVREQPDAGPVVARYRSSLAPGGTIELPDGTSFRLRPPLTGDTWRVRRGLRELIAEFRDPWKPWEIWLAPAARDIYHLPLLTLLAFAAVLVELDTPSGGGGASGASS